MMSFYSRNKGTKLLNSFRFSMWPFRFKIKLRQIRLLIGKSFVVVAVFTAITAQICCDMFQAHRLIAQFALSINDSWITTGSNLSSRLKQKSGATG